MTTPEETISRLEERIEGLEQRVEHLARVIEPPADFDSGPYGVPPNAGLVFEHGFGKKAAEIDATCFLPDGTEAPLPVTVDGGKVFATTPDAIGLRVYNTGRHQERVRVRAYSG